MFSVPIKGRSQCIAGSTGTQERGTFTTQLKRYMSGSKPCIRASITIGKQTNHAKHKHMYW